MKLYKFAVVYAVENEDTFDWSEMLGQVCHGDVECVEIISSEDLPFGWDVECIPFGETDDTIKSIFANQQGIPEIVILNGIKYRRID